VTAEDQLLAGELLKLGSDAAITRVRRELLIFPVREGVRARRHDPVAVLLCRGNHFPAQAHNIGAHLCHRMTDRRADLDLRLVKLWSYLLAERRLRFRQDKMRARAQLSRLRMHDLIFLFDADGERFVGGHKLICSPRSTPHCTLYGRPLRHRLLRVRSTGLGGSRGAGGTSERDSLRGHYSGSRIGHRFYAGRRRRSLAYRRFVGVFVVVQSIEGYILTPRILGRRLSLHPMAVFLGLLIGGKLFGLLGIILAVPTIAIAKVFLKFLRELYTGSHFYHAGDISAAEAPSAVLEERLADAAETVLAEQIGSESGDELLAPDKKDDDPIALGDRS
jgi:hypothetical protein